MYSISFREYIFTDEGGSWFRVWTKVDLMYLVYGGFPSPSNLGGALLCMTGSNSSVQDYFPQLFGALREHFTVEWISRWLHIDMLTAFYLWARLFLCKVFYFVQARHFLRVWNFLDVLNLRGSRSTPRHIDLIFGLIVCSDLHCSFLHRHTFGPWSNFPYCLGHGKYRHLAFSIFGTSNRW